MCSAGPELSPSLEAQAKAHSNSISYYLITKRIGVVGFSRLDVKAVVVGDDQVGREVLGREEAVAGPVDVRGPAVDGRSLVRIFEEPLTGDRGLRGRAEVEDG